MTETSFRFSRRALLAATAASLVATLEPARAAKKHHPADKSAKQTKKNASEPIVGNPLPFPPIVELKDAETFDLVAESATHAFLKDKPVAVIGYGGAYMGPALKIRRRTTPTVRLVNRLDRPTNVHWHGLLVEGAVDGGALPGIAPGETREARLPVDQPAATLWYHAHVHGHVAQDVHDGLAGLLIVEDEATAALGLPSTWGVDDLPLILQDRTFDDAGVPRYPATPEVIEHGFHGPTMIVNGVAEALTTVPERLVRLRLLNASGSRTFRLFFDDQRSFHMIASDAGLLAAPVELNTLPLAPGERAEILVDFTTGPATLMTTPDAHEHRNGDQVMTIADVIDRPAALVAFRPVRDESHRSPLPTALTPLAALPRSTSGLPRRRFELRVVQIPAAMATGHGSMEPAPMDSAAMGHDAAGVAPTTPASRMLINGRSFEMGRIDETVSLGATEVWEIVCPEMAHPFHIHGAHFRVLTEDGERPKLWNGGFKDTVLVENSAELLVTFTRPATAAAPFVYHCHLLEHEDAGMMGAFTVG